MTALKLDLLGKEIVKARRKKNWSQFDLAIELGLPGPASLVAWEKGKSRPQTNSLERLSNVLQLSYSDEVYWRGLAGYIPPTNMPTLEQIKSGLKPYAEHIGKSPFPAYILDHQLRYWVVNQPVSLLLGSSNDVKALLSQQITVFRIVFDTRLNIRQGIQNLESLQLEQIRRFKGLNFFRRHEDFYQKHPQYMQDFLLPDDYKTFESCWNIIHGVSNGGGLPVRDSAEIDEFMLTNHLSAVVGRVNYTREQMSLAFQLAAETIFSLGNVFSLVRYMPVNDAWDKIAKSINLQGDSPYHALWDYSDAEKLLSF